jgi:hypothetical protein
LVHYPPGDWKKGALGALMHVCLSYPVGQKLLQGCSTLDPDRVYSNGDI